MKHAWLAVVAFAACGPLSPPRMDAGQGGGAATGGGTGGGATGGGMGGGATGGGNTGGGNTGGGAPDAGLSWSFSSLGINTTSSATGSIIGLGETDAGVWAMSSSGRLYRSQGGPFSEVVALQDAQPSAYQPRAFVISASGRMFFVTTVWFATCASGCESQASWSFERINSGTTVLSTLCVIDDTHVLAVGDTGGSSDGVSYLWNGTSLNMSTTSLNVQRPVKCWKSANTNDYLIAAANAVVRYDPMFQSFTVEPTVSMAAWTSGASVDGHDWVFASGPRVADFTTTPRWADVLTPASGIDTIRAVVGVSPTLTWGFGGSSSSSSQKLWRFNGTTWAAYTPDLSGFYQLHTAFRASDGSIYFGGESTSFQVALGRAVLR